MHRAKSAGFSHTLGCRQGAYLARRSIMCSAVHLVAEQRMHVPRTSPFIRSSTGCEQLDIQRSRSDSPSIFSDLQTGAFWQRLGGAY